MEMGKEHLIEVKNVLFKVVTHMTMENQIGIQIIILWAVSTHIDPCSSEKPRKDDL